MNHDRHDGPYRARDGILLGVCKGLCQYFHLPLFWVRLGILIAFLITGFWPTAVLYLIASVLMPKAPVRAFATDGEKEFYESYTHDRAQALHRLKRVYDSLDRRIRRMEDAVTARESDWDRRLRENQ